MAEYEKRKSSPMKDFIAGGFGGVCTVVSGHPLDTIKVRLQTMPKPAPGEHPLYGGTFDCARKTIAAEGVRALYKGMAAPIAGAAPIFAVSFFGFSLGKNLQQGGDNKEPLGKRQLFLAGTLAGVFTTAIMAPGERIKTLLQVQQGGSQVYRGPVDVVQALYRDGGIRSIFRGTLATLLRDVPASGVYFMTYEYIKEVIKSPKGNSDIGLLATIFAGGMAGIANWIVAMPADVLKSRLQSSAGRGNQPGMKKIFVTLMREEGPLALYKGITPVMLRAFPANAACFIGYELALKFLNWCLPNP